MITKWDMDGAPKKPSIIGIGAQKAGTTWLSQMLAQNPGVWAPPLKEAQFFSHNFDEDHRRWIPWHFKRGRQNLEKQHAARGETLPEHIGAWFDRAGSGKMFTNHWYKTLFANAPAGVQPMDVTPEYSTLPDEGVQAVAKLLPKAKFIYIIRHPVDRAISQLKMNLTRHKRSPKTLDDWLTEIEDPVLMNRGDYASYVPRWNAQFGKDRLMYIPFGNIANTPMDTLRRIEAFLGLPRGEYHHTDRKVFASNPALTVPEEARAALRAKLETQFAFLNESFPPDFVERIR